MGLPPPSQPPQPPQPTNQQPQYCEDEEEERDEDEEVNEEDVELDISVVPTPEPEDLERFFTTMFGIIPDVVNKVGVLACMKAWMPAIVAYTTSALNNMGHGMKGRAGPPKAAMVANKPCAHH